MNIFIIAEEKGIEKIRIKINSFASFYDSDIDLSFYDEEHKAFDPSAYDRVVVDQKNLAKVKSAYDKTSLDNLFLWHMGLIHKVSEPFRLEEILKQALQNKDWNTVKDINKLMVDLNCFLKKEVLNSYPTQIQLESTSFCNAQCIMCSHYYAGNKGAIDMSDKMLDRISEILPYIKVVIMHGNGEPFSSRLFEKSVDTYSAYGIKLTTSTNLSILTEKHIDRINDSFVDIRVSCDACTKEIYEGIRRNLSFDNLVKNLTALRDRCNRSHKVMASILLRQNLEQLPEMVSFAAEYGFHEIIFSNLGTSRIVGNEMDNTTHYPYLAAKQLRAAIAAGKKLGIIVTIPDSYDLSLEDEEMCAKDLELVHSTPFFKTEEETEEIRKLAESVLGENYRVIENLADCYWEENLYNCNGICEWCIEKPFIDLNGDVFVCCINQQFKVGNIFEYDSFLDLWNNDVYRRIRRLFYEGKLPAFCDNCQFILNGTLERLSVPERDEGFYVRKRISKHYRDYCKEHNYEE